MTILCGTDFSPLAAQAVDVAADLAKRWSEPLRIVHVLDLPGAREILHGRETRTRSRLRELVEEQAAEAGERVRAEYARVGAEAPAGASVLGGAADVEIVAAAESSGARLVVLGALGRRIGGPWRLGSTVDRVAQSSSKPVLVVRAPEGLAAWGRAEGGRPLRVLVAVERSPGSDAAVGWLANLRAAGPCDVVAAHVFWLSDAKKRMESGASPPGGEAPPIDHVIADELRARLDPLLGGQKLALRIEGGFGRIADHLSEIAAGERADVVVVGSRQRSGFDRLWNGSVSRGVIDAAPVSVLCVPYGVR